MGARGEKVKSYQLIDPSSSPPWAQTMSASSHATRVILATCSTLPIVESLLSLADKLLVIIDGEDCKIDESVEKGLDVVRMEPGPLTRRALLDLLVELSAGVDEVIVACKVLEYSPVAEALVVYKWLLENGYRVRVIGECGETLLGRLGFERV